MPLYDYECAACGRTFEVIHGVHADSPTSCPSCGGGPVRKAITAAAIHYKGSGWAKKERHSTTKSASAKSSGDGADAPAADTASSDSSTAVKTETPKPAGSPAPSSRLTMAAAADWITLAEASEILAAANVHFTPATIGGWARAGRLSSIKLGGRRFVRRGEVRALIAAPRRVRVRRPAAGPVRGSRQLRPTGVDVGAILDRFLERPRVAFVRDVLDTYGRAAGGLLANGLAFSALFAVVPTVLLMLGLAGWLVGDTATQQALVDALADVFPPLRELLEAILASITQAAALTSIIGFIGLIWTVSQFHGALDVAFARIFSDRPERDIVRRTARGFLWVALLLAGVVAAIILGGLATLLDAFIPESVPLTGRIAAVVTSPLALLAFSVGAVLFLYRTMPPVAPAWPAIRLPAVIVGIVIVVLAQVFTFLVPRLVGSVALAGSLAAAFVALAWLSFTFQALLYGAAWVRVRDVERSALGGAAPAAEPGGGGE